MYHVLINIDLHKMVLVPMKPICDDWTFIYELVTDHACRTTN